MALEKQKTFKTGVAQTIDKEIEEYLKNNEIDPAAIQIAIDNGNGVKTATVIYAEREALKEIYKQQGRTYSDSDAVTYCHVKDIITPFSEDIDIKVNDFVSDENISIISLSRYFTPVNQGVFIFYIDLKEQQKKMEEKQKELEVAKEELAQQLATEAVKDTDLEQNDTVDKYADAIAETGVTATEAMENLKENTEKLGKALEENLQTEVNSKDNKVKVTIQNSKTKNEKKKLFGKK